MRAILNGVRTFYTTQGTGPALSAYTAGPACATIGATQNGWRRWRTNISWRSTIFAAAVNRVTRLNAIVFLYQTHNLAFSKNLPGYDVRPKLRDPHVPTLVIRGRHDWITPLDQSKYMAATIPSAQLAVFAHNGHGPMSEKMGHFSPRYGNSCIGNRGH